MDISGLVSYEYRTRPVHSTASARGIMTPHLDLGMTSYSQSSVESVISFSSNGYGYSPGTTADYQPVLPTYSHQYMTASPSSTVSSQTSVFSQPLGPTTASRATYAHPPRPPAASIEDGLLSFRTNTAPVAYRDAPISPTERLVSSPISPTGDSGFATDVDTLMRAIQSHSRPRPLLTGPELANHPDGPGAATSTWTSSLSGRTDDGRGSRSPPREEERKHKKRFECPHPGCGKGFYQKTHLDIHTRAHTGHKPFLCREPSCGQRFSQLGNLKTHERRHTGERPYRCEICGKRFAQRGNVRAHRIVHDQLKPFFCKLEDCGKQFTQLGNLKSHQNKFHATALKDLTRRFASIGEGEMVSREDQDLWQYFAELYKNSNKGIKGRGKDRKITTASGSQVGDDGTGNVVHQPGVAGFGDGVVIKTCQDEESVKSPMDVRPAGSRRRYTEEMEREQESEQDGYDFSHQSMDLDEMDGNGDDDGDGRCLPSVATATATHGCPPTYSQARRPEADPTESYSYSSGTHGNRGQYQQQVAVQRPGGQGNGDREWTGLTRASVGSSGRGIGQGEGIVSARARAAGAARARATSPSEPSTSTSTARVRMRMEIGMETDMGGYAFADRKIY